MKFWQSLAFCEPEQCAEVARHAESLGFEGVTLAEHQFYPERLESRFPFSEDGRPLFDEDDEWPDMWPLIGAMATTTRRLRFLTAVHVLPLVHPLSVARSAATADALAPGRIVLGVGAGWMREEYEVFGVDFRTRGRRLDESIEIVRRAWEGEMFEYHGEHFDFERLVVRPSPPSPVPIWIGGTSDPAIRRAARVADGWLGGGGSADELIAQLARIDALRGEAGRQDQPFETLTLHPIGLGGSLGEAIDEVKRLGEGGLGGIVHLPFLAGLGKRSELDAKRTWLDRFADEVMRAFE